MPADPPLIAVTGPHRRITLGWWTTRLVLGLLGCRSCYLTARSTHLPRGVRGVVIGGGDDIDPSHYGLATDEDEDVDYDVDRDRLEISVISAALEHGLPLFGICRGAQLINVVQGGTLYRDIRPLRRQTPKRQSILRIKVADLHPASRLARHLQTQTLRINSLHNQAIDSIAPTLKVAARDRDGFIQAFEEQRGPFILGTQWHPEYLCYRHQQRAIFRLFSDAVKHSRAVLPHREAVSHV